ncbi:alpha/beta fold hydrolase [Streptomyces sp. NPDC059426]|uniref:alpha/beta fold hydrolase n=1 Tax=Streptomyces sp. NPDC059426 TaxID=3346827 RepID=UPI003699D235
MSARARATPLLFLHGNWHGAWCWTEVIAALAGSGRSAVAVDMAGHGLRARRPACLTSRPLRRRGTGHRGLAGGGRGSRPGG